MKSTLHPRLRGGFSLIELLVVILIIAILMGLTIIGTQYAMAKSFESKSRIQIKALETGLENFYKDRMEYPNPSPLTAKGTAGASKELYVALTGDGITAADITALTDGNPATLPTWGGTPDGKRETTDELKWSVYLEELMPASASTSTKALQGWINLAAIGTAPIIDAFGNEIQYVCQVPALATQKNTSYDLWSFGTDSSVDPGTTDQTKTNKWIKNW